MLYKSSLKIFKTNPVFKLPRKERLFAILFCFLSFSVIFRLTILVRRRSADSFSNIDSMAVMQLFIVGLSLCLIVIAPRLKASWRKLSNSGNIYIIIYYFIAISSAIWSGLPKYTAYRAIEFITLFYAIYLFIYYSPTYLNAERKILFVTFLIILLDIGKHIKLGGLSIGSLHTNSYSAVAAMLACYCVSEFFSARNQRKIILFRIGIASIIFLVLGTSSASIISFFVGMLIISFLLKNKLLLFISLTCLIIFSLLFSVVDIKSILFPGKTDEAIGTLTGRTHLWEIYLKMFLDNPIFGTGFAASTRLSELYSTNTHNGFIAVALGTGIIGLTIFCIGIYRIIKDSFTNYLKNIPFGLGILSSLIVGLTNNMAISLFGEQWSPVTAAFTCFLALHILTNPKHKPIRRIVF